MCFIQICLVQPHLYLHHHNCSCSHKTKEFLVCKQFSYNNCVPLIQQQPLITIKIPCKLCTHIQKPLNPMMPIETNSTQPLLDNDRITFSCLGNKKVLCGCRYESCFITFIIACLFEQTYYSKPPCRSIWTFIDFSKPHISHIMENTSSGTSRYLRLLNIAASDLFYNCLDCNIYNVSLLPQEFKLNNAPNDRMWQDIQLHDTKSKLILQLLPPFCCRKIKYYTLKFNLLIDRINMVAS